MKRNLLVLVLMVHVIIIAACADKKIENWKVKINGAIFSTPVIQNDVMFLGTEEGYFYWINANSGEVINQVKLSTPIRSNALIVNDRVYVESAGRLYCFNTTSAEELFKFSPDDSIVDMVDPWDYYHSNPLLYKGMIFYGGNHGVIYVIDPLNGSLIKKIITGEGTAIRTDLTIESETLYFGDNNGVVYQYNLTTDSFTMKFETFKDRPYPTFGYILGKPIIQNDKLFFNSRNQDFTPIDLKSKTVAWTHSDPNGSWWPAGLVVTEEKVIIGGSDNLILSALNVETGKAIWEYKVDYNIFCTPLLVNDALILGTGDSYLNRKGDGSVISVTADKGSLISKYKPGGNVFSSPVKFKDQVIICTTLGEVICIDETFFTSHKESNVVLEGDLNVEFKTQESSVTENELRVKVKDLGAEKISFKVQCDSNLPDSLIKIKGLRDWVYSGTNQNIFFQVNRGKLAPGQYKGKVIFNLENQHKKIVKPFTINVNGDVKTNEPSFEVSDLNIDSKDCTIKFKIKATRLVRMSVSLKQEGIDNPVCTLIQFNTRWGILRLYKDIFSDEFKNLKPGKYAVVFEGGGNKQSFEFILK